MPCNLVAPRRHAIRTLSLTDECIIDLPSLVDMSLFLNSLARKRGSMSITDKFIFTQIYFKENNISYKTDMGHKKKGRWSMRIAQKVKNYRKWFPVTANQCHLSLCDNRPCTWTSTEDLSTTMRAQYLRIPQNSDLKQYWTLDERNIVSDA